MYPFVSWFSWPPPLLIMMNGAYLYSVEKTYLAFIEAQGPAVPTRYIYNASSKALIIERISTDCLPISVTI